MYTPHTKSEIEVMLAAIGKTKIEDLFHEVPEKYRFPFVDLPPILTEFEAQLDLQEIASANATTKDMISFLGAGAYDHYVPAAVDALLRRSEFYTSYTPYQPEISQGTLQAIFEYQSLICALTGMDVSNASHYDGATAAAEAVIMAYHFFRGKRSKVILSRAVNPQYRNVIRTYMQGLDNLQIIGDDLSSINEIELQSFCNLIDIDTALVMVQYPDFFGRIIDYQPVINAAHSVGALVAVVVNPTALGLLVPPGDWGADIVVGEGQPLGIPLSYGGPYLGIFATKNEFVRKIAGRIVGETRDINDQLAYVLTLTAREQHIRREKSTSNICSNQGLLALASTIYLSLLGQHGLKQLANLCYQKAHYAAEKITEIPGFELAHKNIPFFHEFSVICPKPVSMINMALEDHLILGGFDLSHDYPEMENQMLIAVTEKISKDDIDAFCGALTEVTND
jgi:glycine dehydrogenase subunit 1